MSVSAQLLQYMKFCVLCLLLLCVVLVSDDSPICN